MDFSILCQLRQAFQILAKWSDKFAKFVKLFSNILSDTSKSSKVFIFLEFSDSLVTVKMEKDPIAATQTRSIVSNALN